MNDSDLEKLLKNIKDLPIEKATNVKPEDLGLTSTELDQYIKMSKGQLINKDPTSGNYFKKFDLVDGYNASLYIMDPQNSRYTTQEDSTQKVNDPMVYAVRPKINPVEYSVEYSVGSYNMDNLKWNPITENIQQIINLNSQ